MHEWVWTCGNCAGYSHDGRPEIQYNVNYVEAGLQFPRYRAPSTTIPFQSGYFTLLKVSFQLRLCTWRCLETFAKRKDTVLRAPTPRDAILRSVFSTYSSIYDTQKRIRHVEPSVARYTWKKYLSTQCDISAFCNNNKGETWVCCCGNCVFYQMVVCHILMSIFTD